MVGIVRTLDEMSLLFLVSILVLIASLLDLSLCNDRQYKERHVHRIALIVGIFFIIWAGIDCVKLGFHFSGVVLVTTPFWLWFSPFFHFILGIFYIGISMSELSLSSKHDTKHST
jgi:hypothetical protein